MYVNTVKLISYLFVGSVTRSDERSFHASLFEEEWRKRTSVNFDIDDVDQQVVSCTYHQILSQQAPTGHTDVDIGLEYLKTLELKLYNVIA